ncbi:MAG TPA: fumarylacetoacetate hydrolase family protein [Terracidiphilus sp.]|jgi:2-keto-4-pentenoate hydratase/2-oxohepta-3-ene-1,7-dioic acid hydratase in catechol pathway|nr:fumarylacetoacetate hydrolase family protein [Terracidiphilus sp.]
MKLVSFSKADGKVRPGSLLEEANMVVDLSGLGFADAIAVAEAGFKAVDKPGPYPAYKLGDVRLHAPIANPPRVFAIGLNYRDHAIESKMALPKVPVVFFKMNTAIIGPGENIVLPKNSTQPDYEAELAFVIGKGGYRIPASAWREHVYGCTIVNDVSARDVQLSTSQWSLGKSFPTFCPMGPAIVTLDEIADPHELAIGLSINGEVLQNSNTRELIFKIPDLVEYISSITPLLPGDIVSTGTPSGVGMGRTPQHWLKPGDSVTVTVEGLGSLTNPVVAE